MARGPSGTSTTRGLAVVWDAVSGRILQQLRHPEHVVCKAVFGDGERVLTCHDGGACVVWSVASGDRLLGIDAGRTVTSVAVLFPGDRLLTWPGDDEPEIWSTSTGLRVCRIPNIWGVIRISPDGRRVVSGDYSPGAFVWDASSCEQLHELRHGEDEVEDVGYLDGGKVLAVLWTSGSVQTWHSATGQGLHIFGEAAASVPHWLFPVPGGRVVTLTSHDAVVWNATSGERLLDLRPANGFICGVAASPDGGLLAASSLEGAVSMWDLSTGRSMSFRPDESSEEDIARCRMQFSSVAPWDPNSFGR